MMQLTIKKFTVNPIEENTYIVSDPATRQAAIIDCGCFDESEWEPLQQYIADNGLTPVHLLCTHAHFDHVLGTAFAAQAYGLTPQCHEADLPLWQQMDTQVTMFLGNYGTKLLQSLRLPQPTPLREGDTIDLGTKSLQVIATPGHTAGGICFYCATDDVLFAGDSLFRGSIGRTDLPGGNYATLVKSLTTHILTLPPHTRVFCGHGLDTSIDYELNYNPYL